MNYLDLLVYHLTISSTVGNNYLVKPKILTIISNYDRISPISRMAFIKGSLRLMLISE
jgi:hypothetical protein